MNSGRERGSEAVRSDPGPDDHGAAPQAFAWLLGQKIAVPERVAGYVHRAELVNAAMPTRRRLTVLKASGGFGKTTLLAECCRALRERGVPTAWVSLDERDEPAVLDAYIAFACQSAGLDLHDVTDSDVAGDGPERRIGVVVRRIQASGKPFVIAFDELERLENPDSTSLLEFLLERGPSNLHLAVACRRIPDGLNVAGAVLDGRARVVTTEELRFSTFHVAEFFDRKLSRDALAAEMESSLGWPFALRISRNRTGRGGAGSDRAAPDIVENWIESRLFANLDGEDRDFLLDIALLDWMDAPLLDAVFERRDSLRRLRSMRVLVGLLEPVPGGLDDRWRLHPLLREHCVERRFRENPRRFRAIHRRIAGALDGRGEPAPAMRHAVEGGDGSLAGDILERAGGALLWILQGMVQLQAADRHLSEDVVSTRPRLALARCVVRVMSGRVEEARRRYREVRARYSIQPEEASDLFVDDCIARGALTLYGAEPLGSIWARTLDRDLTRLAESKPDGSLARGFAAHGLCVLYQLRAEFDAALRIVEASQRLQSQSRYIVMQQAMILGQVSMARGRVEDAESHYGKAQRIARRSFVLDPVPTAGAELMLRELRLECDRVSPQAGFQRVPVALMKHGMPFSGIAAACAVLIEHSLRGGRIGEALAKSEELRDYTRGAGLTALARYVAALRVSVLVIAGRTRDAERVWRMEELPEDAQGCVDLHGQGWREMEALSCARLRWLAATGRFPEGRDLARRLREAAVDRDLKRTLMRATVLSIVLEQRAGEPEAAAAYLERFLESFAETPYAWPLVQERADCRPTLEAFIEQRPDSPHRENAFRLLAAARRIDEVRPGVLSRRERTVLKLLDGRGDKQLAAELGLTTHGVRYHLRKIFNKLGVKSRAHAVRRARELGMIPDDS